MRQWARFSHWDSCWALRRFDLEQWVASWTNNFQFHQLHNHWNINNVLYNFNKIWGLGGWAIKTSSWRHLQRAVHWPKDSDVYCTCPFIEMPSASPMGVHVSMIIVAWWKNNLWMEPSPNRITPQLNDLKIPVAWGHSKLIWFARKSGSGYCQRLLNAGVPLSHLSFRET